MSVELREGVGAVCLMDRPKYITTPTAAYATAILSAAGWTAETMVGREPTAATCQDDRERFDRAAAFACPDDRRGQQDFKRRAEEGAFRLLLAKWDAVVSLAVALTDRRRLTGAEVFAVLSPGG